MTLANYMRNTKSRENHLNSHAMLTGISNNESKGTMDFFNKKPSQDKMRTKS